MLEDIKESMLAEPEHIVNLLDLYGFFKIKIQHKEIRCAFGEDTNGSSISIKLENNPNLRVTDFGRSISCDLIDYFIKTRGATFRQVLNDIKKEMGIENIVAVPKKTFFGGAFDGINFNRVVKDVDRFYPESILDDYYKGPVMAFMNDGISFATQDKYNIGFDPITQRITIPIRNVTGDIIGIKGRCNYTPAEDEPKYLYLTDSCKMSKTLFGYYQNYESLLNSTIIVLESEKSVMQLDTMGCYKGVALGSNNLSSQQAEWISALCPKCVIFALDNSLPLENTAKNVKTLKENSIAMSNFDIKFFDWTKCNLLPEKASPTDLGKVVFNQIIKHHLRPASELPEPDNDLVSDVCEIKMSESADTFFGGNILNKLEA